jgi:hypothetical protein
MSLELHEWDIHIVCRGTDDASGAAGAAADDPPLQLAQQPTIRRTGPATSAIDTLLAAEQTPCSDRMKASA